MIIDEKTSTFIYLFNKLKEIYGFNPYILTCDIEISIRTALKYIFKDIKLYPCYFHYIRNIIINLLKYFKNKNEKNEVINEDDNNNKDESQINNKKMKKKNKEEFYNLFSNFRIIPFIKNEKENISIFIKLIKDNYINNKQFVNLNKYFLILILHGEKNSI